jgi:excisionase family DNA binding protein
MLGEMVHRTEDQEWISPQQAAVRLGFSHEHVLRLIEAGEIEAERMPGARGRQIPLSAVLAFEERRPRPIVRRPSGLARWTSWAHHWSDVCSWTDWATKPCPEPCPRLAKCVPNQLDPTSLYRAKSTVLDVPFGIFESAGRWFESSRGRWMTR